MGTNATNLTDNLDDLDWEIDEDEQELNFIIDDMEDFEEDYYSNDDPDGDWYDNFASDDDDWDIDQNDDEV